MRFGGRRCAARAVKRRPHGGLRAIGERIGLAPIRFVFRISRRSRRGDDAQGYSKRNEPIRLKAGVLASEAYGVGSCMADRSRFVGANMELVPLGKKWARAVNATRVGYQDARGMIQSLIWEPHPYPVSIDALLASDDLIGKAVAATPFKPPPPPKQVGVVILANKSYPLSAGVAAGYRIVDSIVRAER